MPLDHPLIIQTILLYPSGAVWTDEASNVSRLDPSGAVQIDVEHPSRNRLHSRTQSRLLADRRVWAAEQALQQSRLTWPRGGQHLAGHLPGRVPQRQRDYHHVI
jgi:hypothetical protein